MENQNHTLSRLIGPPKASLKSKLLTILVGVARPAACSSSEKLFALQALVGEGEERGVGEPVAAVARDEVDADAAGRQIGRQRGRVDRDLGRRSHVRRLTADVAAGLQRHRVDAVGGHALIGGRGCRGP